MFISKKNEGFYIDYTLSDVPIFIMLNAEKQSPKPRLAHEPINMN